MRLLLAAPFIILSLIGGGCSNVSNEPAAMVPVASFPDQAAQPATIADYIRERHTFNSFSDVEGRGKPAELEGMDGRNFLYVNNCPNKKPAPECQYRITLFADEGRDTTVFFLQETQPAHPTLYWGPITGPVAELASSMNKVAGRTLYDIP